MNAEIFQAYQKLSDAEKKLLLTKIADSERLVQIVQFIEEKKGVFQNHEIIAAVFKVSSTDTEFAKVRNNYFKLRKKLIEIIESLGPTDEVILPYEQDLMECRKMTKDKQYAAAKRKLLSLKDELWKNNIFEHLNDCIYQLLTVEQYLGTGSSKAFFDLMKEYDLACDLKRDLQKQLFYNLIRYHPEEEPNFMQKIAYFAEKNEAYPRFKIIYYYTVVLAGVSSATPKRTALGSIDKLEKLLENNPEIPVHNYTSDSFLKIKGYWLPMIKMHYAFIHRDFHEGFELMKEYKATMKNNAKVFGGQQNENLFKNEIIACIYAGKFKEAFQIVEELKEFQTLNGKKENHLNNYIEISNIYIFAYPSVQSNQLNTIVSFLDEIIKKAKQSDHSLLKDAQLAAALLLYTYGFKSKALKYFNTKECQEEIKSLELQPLAFLFVEKQDAKSNKEILKKAIKNSSSPLQETYFKWALRMVEGMK